MVDRRSFLGAAGAVALGGSRWASQGRRPNLILILADDLGYGDLSAFGRREYRTPSIDRIGREGVIFTDAHASASTCTPSRVGLLTGRYPARFAPELQYPMGYQLGQSGLSPEIPTLPSRLQAAGYRTALVGKWHLGYLPKFSPLEHGFEEFFGIKSGGVDYFTHRGRFDGEDLWEGEVSIERQGYLTELLTDRAIEVIGRRDPRPFYLSLHYNAPHWPWEGPADGHGEQPEHPLVDGGSAAIYAEMMRSLDAGVGRVMDALRRSGKARDTLVLFTSDNGGERYSYNWPFSEAKYSLYEGGIRVPALLRWPGRVPAGRVTSQVATNLDWNATFLALGGAGTAFDPPLDGIDLSAVAAGTAPPVSRTLFWRQWYGNRPRQYAVRRDHWKYLRIDEAELLFDLRVDPGEKANLATRHPAVLGELREAFDRWNAELPPAVQAGG